MKRYQNKKPKVSNPTRWTAAIDKTRNTLIWTLRSWNTYLPKPVLDQSHIFRMEKEEQVPQVRTLKGPRFNRKDSLEIYRKMMTSECGSIAEEVKQLGLTESELVPSHDEKQRNNNPFTKAIREQRQMQDIEEQKVIKQWGFTLDSSCFETKYFIKTRKFYHTDRIYLWFNPSVRTPEVLVCLVTKAPI